MNKIINIKNDINEITPEELKSLIKLKKISVILTIILIITALIKYIVILRILI